MLSLQRESEWTREPGSFKAQEASGHDHEVRPIRAAMGFSATFPCEEGCRRGTGGADLTRVVVLPGFFILREGEGSSG